MHWEVHWEVKCWKDFLGRFSTWHSTSSLFRSSQTRRHLHNLSIPVCR
jgi:hypothetical protein